MMLGISIFYSLADRRPTDSPRPFRLRFLLYPIYGQFDESNATVHLFSGSEVVRSWLRAGRADRTAAKQLLRDGRGRQSDWPAASGLRRPVSMPSSPPAQPRLGPAWSGGSLRTRSRRTTGYPDSDKRACARSDTALV